MACCVLAACYPGVDNSDCGIRCGAENACPSNLSCVNTFCVDDGQRCVDPDLVLAYSFDTIAEDEIRDDSQHGNTARASGDPMTAPGVHGNALAFDGNGDGLIVPHAPSLAVAAGGAFTVSFWLFVEPQADFTVDQILVGKLRMNDQPVMPFYELGIEFDEADRVVELFLSNQSEVGILACATAPPPIGSFTHVAFTLDGSEVHGYLDGVEQPCNPNVSLENLMIPDYGQNLVIGRQANEQEFFTGKLDDLRIYNRALTRDEIAADINSPVTP